MKSVTGFSWAFLLALLIGFLPRPEDARGQEEGRFTAIPMIKGMKLLAKGTPAPTFVVKDIDGTKYDFTAQRKKKAHLLVFWSIFCEPCREEMPVIEKIHNEFEDRNLQVLAVNLDGDPFLQGMRSYMEQYKFTFRVLLDELSGEDFVISDSYQVAGTPSLYLIDDQGVVFTGHMGVVSEEQLKAWINEMLSKG